jgi:pimeloyl-ACP methyl ester carboxylesterase
MIRKFAIAALAILGALALLAFVALRDNAARQAIGERRAAESDGGVINYFVGGPSGGSLVALLPSYARSTSDFNELVTALHVAGHRTLAMQPRGIDGSSLPSLQTSLHTYAADLLAALTAEAVARPVVVVGHAYGNRIARTFATDFPERTRALVLLAAGGEDPTPPEMTQAISKALFGIHTDAVRREAIEFAFFAEGNTAPEHWLKGWYPRAGLAQARATAGTPFEEWGSGGNAPILVLQPGEDAVAAAGGEKLAHRFPTRVRLVTIAGAGHALLPEQPEAVQRAIVDYLERLP